MPQTGPQIILLRDILIEMLILLESSAHPQNPPVNTDAHSYLMLCFLQKIKFIDFYLYITND